MVTLPMGWGHGVNLEGRLLRLAAFRRMDLVFTICTATCGNGAKTTGIATMQEPLLMELHGYPLTKENQGLDAAVPGSTMLGIAVLPTAAAPIRASPTTTLGFVLLSLPPGLLSNLFSLLPSYSLWRGAPDFF